MAKLKYTWSGSTAFGEDVVNEDFVSKFYDDYQNFPDFSKIESQGYKFYINVKDGDRMSVSVEDYGTLDITILEQ